MSKKAYKNLRWQINNWPRYPISKTLHDTLYFFYYYFIIHLIKLLWPLNSTKTPKFNMIIDQLGIILKICRQNDTPASSLDFDWVSHGPTQLSALASISRSTDICGSRWSTRSEPPHQVTYIYILLISGPVKGSNTTLPRIFDRCRIHSFLTFVPLPTEDLSKNATLASRSLFYANRTHHNFTRGNSIKRPMSRQQ
jgi:hypothetical protein